MFLGIDVGGTHTDAVIVDSGLVIASSKVITMHNDLIYSIRQSLQALPQKYLVKISRITLGTTLAINAVLQDKLDPVGLVLSAGPGLCAKRFGMGKYVHVVKGGLNHCGHEVESLDLDSLDKVLKNWLDSGIKSFAFVSKFSPRNAAHEQKMANILAGLDVNIVMGHSLSGLLNFPRRIATAYINAAIWRIHNEFLNAVEYVFQELNIKAPIYLLKADGGTLNLAFSRRNAVQSVLSGPAASVMGVMALGLSKDSAILLDIGGTTTDIALFAAGAPVLDYKGMSLSYQGSTRYTLVRSLAFLSVAIGGDSKLSIAQHKVTVGPQREGAAMAFGGSIPTLMDALIVAGHTKAGDVQASHLGINALAEQHNIQPQDLVIQAIEYASNIISDGIHKLLANVNSYPIHTIKDLLKSTEFKPQKVWLVGGPAQAMASIIQNKLTLPVLIPKYFEQANAIGAALTLPTAELELFANTKEKIANIPSLSKVLKISHNYTLSDAENMATQLLTDFMHQHNHISANVEITESHMFSTLDEYGRSAKDLRVHCQVKPQIAGIVNIK